MKKYLDKIILILLTPILIYGGLGGQNYFFITFVLFLATTAFLYLALNKKNIYYPPGFYLYMIFLLLFAVNLFWTKDFWSTLWYFLVFSCGFFFWLLAFNLKEEFRYLDGLIVLLGITFGSLAIINNLYFPKVIDSFSLDKIATINHHHIGDVWALIITIAVLKILINLKSKWRFLLLLPLGGFFLYFSQSRSALLSLMAGLIFVIHNYKPARKYLKLFYFLIFTSLFLFVFFAKSKPTILDRVYYIQGIAAVATNPFGIGFGNFGLISGNESYHLFGFSDYSSVAMNLLLEVFAGMGVLGIVFLLWFLKIVHSVFDQTNQPNLIYAACFIILTTNFMIDFTYLIPSVLWLWFISLGLSQKKFNQI